MRAGRKRMKKVIARIEGLKKGKLRTAKGKSKGSRKAIMAIDKKIVDIKNKMAKKAKKKGKTKAPGATTKGKTKAKTKGKMKQSSEAKRKGATKGKAAVKMAV